LNGAVSASVSAQGSNNVVLSNCSLYDNSNSGTALTDGGSATISALSVNVVGGISGSSNITTTCQTNSPPCSSGITTGVSPIADPYAGVPNPIPTGPILSTSNYSGTQTLNPGVYTNGIKLTSHANITLSPGTYYIEGNTGLDVAGGATLTGTGVTLVFTSNNGSTYAPATINGGANINLTAPTTGTYAGIAIFGDRQMPTTTNFKFNGGATQIFGGAIYVPKGSVQYAGGANATTGCTQLIADTITFNGNSNFALNCNGFGTTPIGTAAAALVE
jgi:hypothetical protein